MGRFDGRKDFTPRLNCKVMGSMNGNGLEIEKAFVESWAEVTNLPYRRNIRMITNDNPIFLQDLSRFIHSLKYKITIVHYEPLIYSQNSNYEVLGVLKGIKNDEKWEKLRGMLLYPGVLLFIVGFGLFLMSVNFAWFYSLLGSLGILLFFGIILRSPQEDLDQLIILFDVLFIEKVHEKVNTYELTGLDFVSGKSNLYSDNVGSNKSEENSIKSGKISEIDFKVGGTASRDVDKVLNYLHNYKMN